MSDNLISLLLGNDYVKHNHGVLQN